MSEPRRCPECGAPLPEQAQDGRCRACAEAGGSARVDPADADTVGRDENTVGRSDVPAATQFGDYELLEELARGGMGVVFRARHTKLNRVVALKMILDGRFASEVDVQRFRQEAEAAANLDHPGIVPVYEIGEHEGHHYFSMKLIDGPSLAQEMESLRHDPRTAAAVIARVARAVHHAHQRGILHRDLKPANILLDEQGNPLVTDLGLARNLQSGSDLTNTGAILGTPAYMPPEQAAGESEITTAADIYSLGAILYEALVGIPPHREESPLQTLRKVMEEAPLSLRERDEQIDRTLDLIGMKCLARDPDARYSSAAALADDLEAWLADEPVSVRPPSLGGLLASAVRTNLKSAIGAGLIGLGIGGIFTWGAAAGLASGGFRRIGTISERFPSEPSPVVFNRIREFAMASPLGLLLFSVLMLAGFFLIGLLNVWLVRPKRGAPSLAVGAVCGLVMTVTIYFATGFLVICHYGPNQTGRDIRDLADVAFSPPDVQEKARASLLTRHPDIMTRPAAVRGRDFGQLLYDRGVTGIPGSIALGMALAGLLGFLPATLGTTFARRVLDEERPRHAYLLYLELMVALAVLVFGAIFQMMIGLRGDVFAGYDFGNVYTWRSWAPGLLVGSLAVYAVYTRRDWRLRLVLFIAAIAARNAFE